MTFTSSQALATLRSLVQLPDGPGSKAAVVAIAQGAGLDTTSFVEGDPSERQLEYTGRAMAAWNVVPQQAARCAFFALTTDPGDVDDFGDPDPSADQTPRPGFLSAFGAGYYGTERGGKTSSTSFVTVKNAGTTATLPFAPGQLTFDASLATRSDGGTPTYVSTSAPAIYTGIGGTLTIAAGASATIPVQCVQLGSYGSVAAGQIDTCVTQSFGTLVVTASTTAVGQEREARTDYVARCLVAPDSNAPGGPQKSYQRAGTTDRAGNVLQRYDGSGEVNITTVYVSPSSSTGTVTLYFAGPAGAVDAVDVATANANILGVALGVITDPVGVVPDCVTVLPGAPGGASCTNDSLPVTWSAKIAASNVPGGASAGTYTSSGSPPANVLAVATAANAALGAYLLSTGIGGLDKVAGAGVVYTDDLGPALKGGAAGLYNVQVTAPSSVTTTVALGHVSTLGATTWSLTVV